MNPPEAKADYGDALAEHRALCESVAVLDLSSRGRICLVGTDRVRFLHGQVTNDIKRLKVGEGCYAALTTAKGKLQSDLNIYCLQNELLLDFEPGLTQTVSERLERFIVSDDVQVANVEGLYGLLSLQGPKAGVVLLATGIAGVLPAQTFDVLRLDDPVRGELYVMNQPRLGTVGFDLFVPEAAMAELLGTLLAAAETAGGQACGYRAFEMARIEAGIPRFGQDMDESNLPLEAGLGDRAISFNKGCYIGQEVLNRIHTLGHVAKELRGLRLVDDLQSWPSKGDRLYLAGKEAGYLTSAIASPRFKANIALAYVRRESSQAGTELILRSAAGESPVRVVDLPFQA